VCCWGGLVAVLIERWCCEDEALDGSLKLMLPNSYVLSSKVDSKDLKDLQSTPNQRNLDWPIIRICIYNRRRIAVPPHLPTLVPQNRPIQIRRRDTEERQVRDSEWELEDHQEPHVARESPFSRDEEAAHG
jgi:hypothetical protein